MVSSTNYEMLEAAHLNVDYRSLGHLNKAKAKTKQKKKCNNNAW